MMGEVSTELFQLLYELEESLWRAETRFNDELMEKTFSADFIEYGRSGRRYTRNEMFFEGQHSETIQAVLTLPQFRVRRLARDVLQVTYVSQVSYEGDIEYANRSSIWSLMNGSWKLLFHQGTPVSGKIA